VGKIPKSLADLANSGRLVQKDPGSAIITTKEGKSVFLRDIATVKEVKRPTCIVRSFPSEGR